jgi:hypothetical protein
VPQNASVPFVVVLVLSQLVPPPPPVGAAPTDGGWYMNQPLTLQNFPADSGTRGMSIFQVRPNDGGSYGDGNAFTSPPQNATQVQAFQVNPGFVPMHQSAWCWHAQWSNDAGYSGWSEEYCFRYDLHPPTLPVIVDGGVVVDGGLITLIFDPSFDDASGVAGYTMGFAFAPMETLQDNSYYEVTDGGPVHIREGVGPIDVGIIVYDIAGNSTVSDLAHVVITQTPTVLPTPDPPVMQITYDPSQIDVIAWSGGSYVTAFRTHAILDGGFGPWLPWFSQRNPSGGFGFYLPFEGPLAVETAAVDQLGNVSPWTQDSQTCGWDKTPPTAPASMTAAPGAGATVAQLTWPGSTDVWSGVDSYELDWAIDTGSFTALGVTDAGAYGVDTGAWGNFTFRVRSVDRAGNHSMWTVSNSLALLGPSDAGSVDAGAPDAGLLIPPDAGSAPDAGAATNRLAVGCGCGSAPGLDVLMLLSILAFRPRRR